MAGILKACKRKPIGIYRRTTRDTVRRRRHLKTNSSTIKRGLGDLKGFPRDKRRVSSLALKICSRINSIKRSKRTAYKKSEILRNYKALIETPFVYYMQGL